MFVVEMHRVPRPAEGYDNLHCPGGLWLALLDLGKAFGWTPKGCCPAAGDPADRYLGYEPGMYGCPLPIVDVKDAQAWAEALGRALHHMDELKVDLPHSGPVIINTNEHAELNDLANAGLDRAFIREFIGYIRRGSFDFAWDD